MTTLSDVQIRALLSEYGARDLPERAIRQIQVYLEAYGVWSKRVSLSTIREPAHVVQRHFGESFALSSVLPEATDLLDLGSGAGFPGIPIALARPQIRVTLAEAQAKKVAFLREVTAQMELDVEVWSRRAEDLIGQRQFGIVALRAVDDMQTALHTGVQLLRSGGSLAFFVGPQQQPELPKADWAQVQTVNLPGCAGGAVIARLR